MKKITLVLLLIISVVESKAQVLLSESFDTALNWNVVNLSASTNAGWTRATTGGNPSCSPFAGAGMARFNSYSISAGLSYELNSPAISFTGGSYRVKLSMFRDTGYPDDVDYIQVYYNTVAGSTNGTLIGTINRFDAVSAWNGYTFLIPGNPASTGYISLKATSAFGNNMFVDEVRVENVPACAEPNSLTASGISSTGATITWTAPASAPANGYEYYLSTTSTAPTNATVATGTLAAGITSKVLTGLNSGTFYYFYVRSICSSTISSPWSNGLNFASSCAPLAAINQNFDNVNVPALPLCWSSILSGATLSTYASVRTTTISASAPNSVSLYNSDSTDSDNIMLVSPQLSNLSAGVNRLKFTAKTDELGQNIFVGTITNPTDASTFTPLQTIVLTENFAQYAVNFSSYTGSDTYIAFRRNSSSEYTTIYIDDVLWEAIPSCVEPTAPVFSSITPYTATISWTAPSTAPANGYSYYASTSSVAPTSATTPSGSVAAGVVTANLSALNPATNYYFWIRANCSSTSSSQWSVSNTFLTACISVATLPWTENFDSMAAVGVNIFPVCWFKENGDYSTSNETVRNTARSGPNYLRNAWSSTNEFIWTPGITLTAGTSYDFSYWTQGDGGTGWTADSFVSTTQVSAAATQFGTTYSYPGTGTISIGTYVLVKNSFTPSTSGTYYFAVRVNQPSGAPWYVAFDDFSISVTPQCTEPTSLVVSSITADSASVSWSAAASAANGYDYYLSTSNVAPTVASAPTGSVAAGVVTKALTGLQSATVYYVWLRSKCTSTENSTWTNSSIFTTLCVAAQLPYTVDFENTTAGSVPVCAQVVNEGTGNSWNVVNAATSGFTTNFLRYSYNSTNSANTWFYTNSFSLTAGTRYTVSYKYGNNSTTYVESLRVAYGTAKTSASMTNTVADYPSITGGAPNTAAVSITPTTSGDYYLGFQAYSIANQLSLFVDDISVNVTLANNSFNNDSFKFYPNPVTDILNLEYTKDISSVAVFNLLGQEVLIKSINAAQSQIDMSNLSAGTYLVKIKADGSERVIKVNKQ